jgi:hypothetical protein
MPAENSLKYARRPWLPDRAGFRPPDRCAPTAGGPYWRSPEWVRRASADPLGASFLAAPIPPADPPAGWAGLPPQPPMPSTDPSLVIAITALVLLALLAAWLVWEMVRGGG